MHPDKKKRGFRLWLALLALLLILGVWIAVRGLVDYDRSLHIPGGMRTACTESGMRRSLHAAVL